MTDEISIKVYNVEKGLDELSQQGWYRPYDPTALLRVASTADIPYVDDLRTVFPDHVPRINSFSDLQALCDTSYLRTKGWVAPSIVQGQYCWKLVGYYVRSGAAVFIPKFLKQDGSPLAGVRVTLTWPGAPASEQGEVYKPNYTDDSGEYTTNHGVAGWTNDSGDVGFGYSGNAAYQNGHGVFRVWPLIPLDGVTQPQFADAAINLGWFGGTDHDTVNPIFQLLPKTGDTTPPPPTELGVLSRIEIQLGNEIGYIQIVSTGSGNAMYFLDKDDNVIGVVPIQGV